jgi:mRNA interferase MazF
VQGVHRGEVWDVELPEIGRHPIVVITREEAIPFLSSLVVAEVTSTIRGIPSEARISPSFELDLDYESVVNCDNLFTVHAERFLQRRGTLSYAEVRSLGFALRVALEVAP